MLQRRFWDLTQTRIRVDIRQWFETDSSVDPDSSVNWFRDWVPALIRFWIVFQHWIEFVIEFWLKFYFEHIVEIYSILNGNSTTMQVWVEFQHWFESEFISWLFQAWFQDTNSILNCAPTSTQLLVEIRLSFKF